MMALGPGAEFDLIRAILRDAEQPAEDRAATPAGAVGSILLGPGDDCAVLADGRVAISVDSAIEGIHFRRDWITAEEIGQRAAAAALSDLAAMAALPIGVLAALAVPAGDAKSGFARKIMAGLVRASGDADAELLGGDLSRSPGPLVITTTVVGTPRDPLLTRAGAVIGDDVWVTGELGGAAAAVEAWRAGQAPSQRARDAYARPIPRIREARWLAARGLAHALIDVSDGVSGDAGHIAAASGVRIVIDPGTLPYHEALLQEHIPRLALTGGEDYELLFTAAAGGVEPHAAEFQRTFGIRLTRIGEVAAGRAVWVRAADGSEQPAPSAYDHFSP